MPKLKTHKGAAKRVRLTATGKIKRGHSHARHILDEEDQQAKATSRHRCAGFEGRSRSSDVDVALRTRLIVKH